VAAAKCPGSDYSNFRFTDASNHAGHTSGFGETPLSPFWKSEKSPSLQQYAQRLFS